MSGNPLVIAIDGPSGSGKSTLSRRLAGAYGLAYLDTGSTFRAVTLWCLRLGVELTDQDAVVVATQDCPLVMEMDPADPRVLLEGDDVTDLLHTGEISAVVSHVAVNLGVRAWLAGFQRGLIAEERTGGRSGGRGIVAEGRDITTVIAPDADVRILLIADPAERLARRARERHGVIDPAAIAATRDEVLRRDAQDSTVSEFMRASNGVATLDNSAMAADETFAAACQIIAEITGRHPKEDA
ncbi:MAG TPA: (d)CMP kinase [Actinomycetaceae bacterium]|nr:(d)CMP kinase [Actinomycetaceae bacterium]